MADDLRCRADRGRHNTLAAALHLAAKGWRVGVFEQAAEPGGAVKTGEYTLPGFRHDWAAMNLSLFAGARFSRQYGEELARHGCAFVPVTDPSPRPFPMAAGCGVSTDRPKREARHRPLSSRDAETWERCSRLPGRGADAIFGLLGSPMKCVRLHISCLKRCAAKGLPAAADLARFLLSSPRQWLTATFESPQVQAMLGAWGMHLDFAPDIAGGGLFPYLEGMAGQAFGMALGARAGPIPSSRRWSRPSGARRRGGMRAAGDPHPARRRAGQRDRTGGRAQVMARRAVIAGVAPRACPGWPGRWRPAFDGRCGFHPCAGHDDDPSGAGRPARLGRRRGAESFAYVHLAPSLDQMARTYQQAQAGPLPDEPILVVGQPTSQDPSRAPEGRHVLWLQVRMVPGTIRGDAAGRIAATDWTAAAEPMAERALDILEPTRRARPASWAAHRDAGRSWRPTTPTWSAAIRSAAATTWRRISCSARRAAMPTARPRSRALHLTGAAVWPGAGTGAGAGYLLARRWPENERQRSKKPNNRETTMKLNRRTSAETIPAATAVAWGPWPAARAQAIDELVIAYNVNLPSPGTRPSAPAR
jgi:phytoene dehydrogenase-like protein